MTKAHLAAPCCVLGEIEEDHTAIPNLAERARAFGVLMRPGLWGRLNAVAIRGGTASRYRGPL